MTIDCELTEDDFLARFKPVPNPIDPNAGFDGCLFETFGDDLAYVQAQDPNLVWTVLDCDGQLCDRQRISCREPPRLPDCQRAGRAGPHLQRRLRGPDRTR